MQNLGLFQTSGSLLFGLTSMHPAVEGTGIALLTAPSERVRKDRPTRVRQDVLLSFPALLHPLSDLDSLDDLARKPGLRE